MWVAHHWRHSLRGRVRANQCVRRCWRVCNLWYVPLLLTGWHRLVIELWVSLKQAHAYGHLRRSQIRSVTLFNEDLILFLISSLSLTDSTWRYITKTTQIYTHLVDWIHLAQMIIGKNADCEVDELALVMVVLNTKANQNRSRSATLSIYIPLSEYIRAISRKTGYCRRASYIWSVQLLELKKSSTNGTACSKCTLSSSTYRNQIYLTPCSCGNLCRGTALQR